MQSINFNYLINQSYIHFLINTHVLNKLVKSFKNGKISSIYNNLFQEKHRRNNSKVFNLTGIKFVLNLIPFHSYNLKLSRFLILDGIIRVNGIDFSCFPSY